MTSSILQRIDHLSRGQRNCFPVGTYADDFVRAEAEGDLGPIGVCTRNQFQRVRVVPDAKFLNFINEHHCAENGLRAETQEKIGQKLKAKAPKGTKLEQYNTTSVAESRIE